MITYDDASDPNDSPNSSPAHQIHNSNTRIVQEASKRTEEREREDQREQIKEAHTAALTQLERHELALEHNSTVRKIRSEALKRGVERMAKLTAELAEACALQEAVERAERAREEEFSELLRKIERDERMIADLEAHSEQLDR